MPVYLFTLHAYRSWNADRPRGFVQLDRGLQPPNEKLARAYDRAACEAPMIFKRQHQTILLWSLYDACDRRQLRLHSVATDPTHIHFLVSWPDERSWKEVLRQLKNVASLMLGRKLNSPGRRWFVRRGSRKRVKDRRHFSYLMDDYLPGHRGEKWREGETPPREPPAAAGGY